MSQLFSGQDKWIANPSLFVVFF